MANVIVDNAEMRNGSCSVSSSNGIPVLNETYHLLVKADSLDRSRIEILYDTPGLPQVGITTSAYGSALCKSVNATRRERNPLYWDVTCVFSSEVDEGSQDPGNPSTQDPEIWVPVYETKFERLQEVVTADKDGDPIANSAGQPFSSGLTIGRFIPVWELFQFESAAVTDEILIARNETVNSTTFRGRAAKTLLLTIITSKIGYYYGSLRRLTQYSLKYNSKKWTHKRLDTGTVYKALNEDTFEFELKPYFDKDERTIINGPLNGSGEKQADGEPPHVLEFDLYEPISFSFLR